MISPLKPLLVIFRGQHTCLIVLNTALISYFAAQIEVSPAVMLSFNTLTSFMTALTFWILYKEKLGLNHLVGMGLIMSSVIIIGIGKSQLPSSTTGESPPVWKILIPIGLVLFQCLIFTSTSVLTRVAVK